MKKLEIKNFRPKPYELISPKQEFNHKSIFILESSIPQPKVKVKVKNYSVKKFEAHQKEEESPLPRVTTQTLQKKRFKSINLTKKASYINQRLEIPDLTNIRSNRSSFKNSELVCPKIEQLSSSRNSRQFPKEFSTYKLFKKYFV